MLKDLAEIGVAGAQQKLNEMILDAVFTPL